MILAYVDNCGTQIPCERLCPRVELCECDHCGLIIDFAWVHLLIIYLHATDDQCHLSFCLLHNWANSFQVDFLCKPFESSLSLIPWTLSLREQMIVSHEYGSSLGELLLIQGSMGKFVKFLAQFNSKKKKEKEKKIGASKLGIGFICSIEKGEKKILSWFD